MKLNHLDDLDQLMEYNTSIQGKWIELIPDRELYEISVWLLHHLGPNKFSSNHDRTRLRDICEQYYLTRSWSEKQKFYLGYGIINLWPERQLEQDPRYLL